MGAVNKFIESIKDWTGPQVWIGAALIFVFAAYLFIKFFFLGAKTKFEAAQKEKLGVVEVLQSRVKELEAGMAALNATVEELRQDKDYDREYRHCLANRLQLMKFHYDAARDFIRRLLGQCQNTSPILVEEFEAMKSSKELLDTLPMPEPPGKQNASRVVDIESA